MQNTLCYRRQFLLANQTIDNLQSWQYHKIEELHLYAHPDLEVTVIENGTTMLILLGYIFDPTHPEKSNSNIISEVISKMNDFDDLIASIKPFTGRYALIYKDDKNFLIFHDALGLREIYYCTEQNRVICGSQPNLLEIYSDPKLGITRNKNILHFYENDMKLVRSQRLWVGDETYFHKIKHLMPNHYLNIQSLTTHRYWPNKRLEKISLDIAVRKSCDYLRCIMKAVTLRYSTMMAVTSGFDSRSLLAASRDVQNKVYYFINKHPHMESEHPDIRIPRSMLNKVNIPFHIHEIETVVDVEFRQIFLDNVFMSHDLLLPAIYNIYFKNHANKVNLLGVGELGREYYGDTPSNLDGYYLASRLKYRSSRYATDQCEKWLQEVKDFPEKYNIDIMKLFLWEGLLGNWGAVGNSESDIAIEEFDPYDSHYIYEIMLSIDRENIKNASFFKAIFKEMWPELLDFPFNPPLGKMDYIKQWLNVIGVYEKLKKFKYKYDRWRFFRKINEQRS